MRRGGALVVLILMMMWGAGARVMRVDRVDVQLIGDAVGLLQPVIRLHRRRLHRREVREGLESALIGGTVTSILDRPMRRRQGLIVVRTVTGGRGTTDGSHRRRAASASTGAATTGTGRRSANLMQIRLVSQHVLQVVRRVVVMIRATVARRGVRRGDIIEERAQVIVPGDPHGRTDAAHTSVHILVGLLMLVLLRIVQVTVRG